jgi:diguanylate cyclase (GGDEF)-like protein
MEKRIKVLFIDHEQGEYLLIADLLSRVRHVRYELAWIDRLDAALDAIVSGAHDVVLIDFFWGDRTARELLNTLKTQLHETPVVVMTDEMETEVDSEAIASGASDYLIKGQIDSQLLERTLRYAIERKQAELHLNRLAHYDSLTDIPNRILFLDRLEHAVRLAERDHAAFAIMFVDLNGFKQVNDSFGHDVGDAVIRMCAERLCECMRRSDSVARMGGDEFTLLLENTDNSTDIARIAEKIIEMISSPFLVNGYELHIGCSIGIALYPEAGRDADALLKSADMAMYQAKEEGESTFRFFTEHMNREVRQQLRLEMDLSNALRHDEFFLEYQPRIDLRTGKILTLEALLRWRSPERGLLNASKFIGVAENTGLITQVGYWVIRQACSDLKRLQQEYDRGLSMAINLSVRQFSDGRMVQQIASILDEAGVPGKDVEFELNETTFMDNIELISLCVRPLSHMGISFSMDHFGAGSSSFLHLQRLPLSTIKIDSRFMAGLHARRIDRRLVSAMINLAHNLGKSVVAQGVETREQAAWLEGSGCDQAQGYYYCPPQTLDQLCETLQKKFD